MADWASAALQGLGAAADTGAAEIGNQIKSDQQLQQQQQLEQTAADIKVDTAQRLAAADAMMKNQSLNNYARIVREKKNEQVPLEAPTWQKTGLTPSSWAQAGATPAPGAAPAAGAGAAADDDDDDDDDSSPAQASAPTTSPATPPAATSTITGDMSKVNGLMQKAQDTLRSPGATDQQKADAQMLIQALNRQIENQTAANKASVQGQTRARTLEEAVDAANEWALQNDPEAYVAGTTAYNNANSDDIAEKKLKLQGAIAQANGDRQLKLEQMKDDARYAMMTAKWGADGTGAAKDPADVATIKYLVGQGMPFEQARDYVLSNGQGARKDPVAMASSLAASLISSGMVHVTKDDPPGTTIMSKAMGMAIAGQAQANQQLRGSGMLDSPAPGATVPNPFNTPGLPQGGADPLGLFSK